MAKGRTRLGRFRAGQSGNPEGIRKDGQPAQKAVTRLDDWQNFFTGAGVFGKDKRVGANFALHNLSFDQLKDLWLGDDLASRAVETIPKEAMRQGYDIVISSSQDEDQADTGMDPTELASEVTQKLDLLGADDYLEVCGGYERGYGGGAMLIGANDGQEDMTKPLNLDRVRELNWITPLEARELMPLYAYNDPRAPKYGQPEIYQLNSRNVLPSFSGNYASTTMMIHESRLLVFPGIRVSRYQTTTARGGWGESVLSRVFRVLRDFNTAWSSAGVLVSDFAQSVIKIAGLWEALALDGDKAFQNRLAAMEYGRSVTNAVTIDAGDSYERQQTPLTGLPDLLEKFAVRLAAACDMPLTLLFGTSPAGMNATGESDVRFFYDRVAAYQNRKMVPALRRLCQIIFRTIGNKKEPDKWSVKFRPLWQDSAKDRAAAMLTQAQADAAWITAGVLSPEEVATAHWGKGEYDPNITVDFEARDDQEAAAGAPVSAADLAALDPDHYMYQPPPEPGTATPPAPVPSPGKPAAPDPNTPPKSIVRAEDSADAIRHDLGDPREQVLAQLAPDFPDDALEWVREAYWEGPEEVPVDDIDFAGATSWAASSEPEKVAKFVKRIQGGWMKPLVLVKRPDEEKLMVADGHHRALAYYQLQRPAMAYIAHVPTDQGPWDEFHSSQGAEHDPDRSDERDERARFAGKGYGMPSATQAAARGGHERMAGEQATRVEKHADLARQAGKEAQGYAATGDWDAFTDASRSAIGHQANAANAMVRVTYHAERAGTETARGHAQRAAIAISGPREAAFRRVDEWSDAAREAALEARKNGASKTAATAHGHAAQAKQLSEKAKKTGKTEDHRAAAQAHEQASRSFERAGQKYAGQAGEHDKAAGDHREHVPVSKAQAAAASREPVAKTKESKSSEPKTEPGKHGEKTPSEHAVGKHGEKAEHAGKHGGQHEPHEKGGHGKEHSGKEHGEKKGLLSKAGELAKIAGETVAGKESAKLAGQLTPGGGEGGEE